MTKHETKQRAAPAPLPPDWRPPAQPATLVEAAKKRVAVRLGQPLPAPVGAGARIPAPHTVGALAAFFMATEQYMDSVTLSEAADVTTVPPASETRR